MLTHPFLAFFSINRKGSLLAQHADAFTRASPPVYDCLLQQIHSTPSSVPLSYNHLLNPFPPYPVPSTHAEHSGPAHSAQRLPISPTNTNNPQQNNPNPHLYTVSAIITMTLK